MINLEPAVRAMYQKSISAQLCPTTVGQAAIDVVVNPPKKGEPSYEQFQREKMAVLNSLKERAKLVADTFNSFEGFSCNNVQGAMYAFPQIQLPQKVIEAAKQANQAPDVFYAFQLLEETGKAQFRWKNGEFFENFRISSELLLKLLNFLLETGICIVAGSGFGQRPGTYHFRTTILPQTDKLKEMLAKFEKFHQKFMAKYKWIAWNDYRTIHSPSVIFINHNTIESFMFLLCSVEIV